MTAPETLPAAAAGTTGIALAARGWQLENGSIKCEVTCNHQTATLIFTGTDVMVDIPDTVPSAPGNG